MVDNKHLIIYLKIFLRFLKNNNYLQKVYNSNIARNGSQNDLYKLDDSCNFILDKTILNYIREPISEDDKLLFLITTGNNNKPQMRPSDYKKYGENNSTINWIWFRKLYDNNLEGNILVFNFNDVTKELTLSVKTKEIDNNNIDIIKEEILENKDSKSSINKPHQRIFFGAPGTGKSHKLNKEAEYYFENDFERVTFHANYMYSNFIGVFKPFPVKIEDNVGNIVQNITYKYVPGILLKMILKALKEPNKPYLLIIEEINRANVSAVFGEFFQLLDRDKEGNSEYHINISEDIRIYIQEEIQNCTDEQIKRIKEKMGENYDKIIIPKNLYIWATMNSADQGVMPLDTAFKRRWDFEYIDIDNGIDDKFKNYKFEISKDGNIVNWNDFRVFVNDILSECRVPEDKLIGPYFIPKHILEKQDFKELSEIIANKVLMYLYDDVGRAHRNEIFKQENTKTFSSLRKAFNENALSIFNKKFENNIFKQELNEEDLKESE